MIYILIYLAATAVCAVRTVLYTIFTAGTKNIAGTAMLCTLTVMVLMCSVLGFSRL